MTILSPFAVQIIREIQQIVPPRWGNNAIILHREEGVKIVAPTFRDAWLCYDGASDSLQRCADLGVQILMVWEGFEPRRDEAFVFRPDVSNYRNSPTVEIAKYVADAAEDGEIVIVISNITSDRNGQPINRPIESVVQGCDQLYWQSEISEERLYANHQSSWFVKVRPNGLGFWRRDFNDLRISDDYLKLKKALEDGEPFDYEYTGITPAKWSEADQLWTARKVRYQTRYQLVENGYLAGEPVRLCRSRPSQYDILETREVSPETIRKLEEARAW